MNTRTQDFKESVNTFLGKAKRLAGRIRQDFQAEFGDAGTRRHRKHRHRPSKFKEESRAEGGKAEPGDKVEHAAE